MVALAVDWGGSSTEGDTMNLRSVLLATAMASGMCSYAMAADMPLKAPPPPAPVEVYSWTGFYLGGEWSRYHSTITSGNGSVRASDSPHTTNTPAGRFR